MKRGGRGEQLPDLYDPEQPLNCRTPNPVYHITDLGGFVAANGRVRNTSPGLAHWEGRPVKAVVKDCLGRGHRVRRVFPHTTKWHEVPEWPVVDGCKNG